MDVSEAIHESLIELGFDSVHATAAECFEDVADCAQRQHIVLNAIFVNSTWRARLPRSSLLYNLEQLELFGSDDGAARRDERTQRTVLHHNPDGWDAGEGELGDADELATAHTAALGVTLDHVAHGVVEAATHFLWLDYSYLNADVAATHMPCVFVLPIGVSTTQRTLQFSAEAVAEADQDARMLPEMHVVHVGGVEVTRREDVLDVLRDSGVKGYVVEGFFGARRARLLETVSVGLNIHRNEGRQACVSATPRPPVSMLSVSSTRRWLRSLD